MRRSQFLPLGEKLKHRLILQKTVSKTGQSFGKCNKSDLIYSIVHSFYKYSDIKKFNKLSIESKRSLLTDFLSDLNRFSKTKPGNEKTKKTKMMSFEIYIFMNTIIYQTQKEKRWALILSL